MPKFYVDVVQLATNMRHMVIEAEDDEKARALGVAKTQAENAHADWQLVSISCYDVPDEAT